MTSEARLAKGATWFYWVAALSLVNALLAVSGQDWRLIMGLGITDILCYLPTVVTQSKELGVPEIAFIISGNVLVAAFVAAFGYFSLKRHIWVFVLGTILYLADAALLLIGKDWFSLAFHAYVLYLFFDGIKACFDLKAAAAPAPPAPPAPPPAAP
jgi:hypothetical protein